MGTRHPHPSESLATAYEQLNSSVGAFATNTLIADSKALASGSAGDDSAFAREQHRLAALLAARDALARQMKSTLAAAAAGATPNRTAVRMMVGAADALITASAALAAHAGA